MPLRAALNIGEGEDTPELARLTAAALHGLVEQDVVQLSLAHSRGRPLPPLYRSGVVYLHELNPSQDWASIEEILAMGGGVCMSLAAWRLAELKAAGVDARPLVFYPDRSGPVMMHAQVGVLAKPANIKRWRELTEEQIRGVELPGPPPELRKIPGDYALEDPSRVLGM